MVGTQSYLRRDWPTTEYALAPQEVEEYCKAEWERHLTVALPVLAIHDASQRVAAAQEELVDAVRAARTADASWKLIGEAAGISSRTAQERWSGPAG